MGWLILDKYCSYNWRIISLSTIVYFAGKEFNLNLNNLKQISRELRIQNKQVLVRKKDLKLNHNQ